MAKCNRCDAPIVWVQPALGRGRWLALDEEPVANGEWLKLSGTAAVEFDDPEVAKIVARNPTAVEGRRHRAHSETCVLRGLRPLGEVAARVVDR